MYFDNNVNDFFVFKSNEPEKFVKFICENVAGMKLDTVLDHRQAEIANAAKQFPQE